MNKVCNKRIYSTKPYPLLVVLSSTRIIHLSHINSLYFPTNSLHPTHPVPLHLPTQLRSSELIHSQFPTTHTHITPHTTPTYSLTLSIFTLLYLFPYTYLLNSGLVNLSIRNPRPSTDPKIQEGVTFATLHMLQIHL